MKTLKTVGLFVTGFVAGICAMTWTLERNGRYPREGATVYENDEFKVVRSLPEKHEDFDPAVIVYKNNQ